MSFVVFRVISIVGYGVVAQKADVYNVYCMAHVRRYFFKVFNRSKRKKGLFYCVMQQIQKLCHLDGDFKKDKRLPEALRERCLAEAKLILDAIHTKREEATAPEQSALGKVIAYCMRHYQE
jgi:hypothetical protein